MTTNSEGENNANNQVSERSTNLETDREQQQPPAPPRECKVRPGGNGDQFLVFGESNSDDRNVEVLNEDDARDLYQQLGERLDEEIRGDEQCAKGSDTP